MEHSLLPPERDNRDGLIAETNAAFLRSLLIENSHVCLGAAKNHNTIKYQDFPGGGRAAFYFVKPVGVSLWDVTWNILISRLTNFF